MAALGGDADPEHLLIDSTVIRAHRHSAGAGKKGAIGRSRGGLSTKVHVAAGAPVRLVLTAGQAADVTRREVLISGIEAEHRSPTRGMTALPCSARSNRKEPRAYDNYI